MFLRLTFKNFPNAVYFATVLELKIRELYS